MGKGKKMVTLGEARIERLIKGDVKDRQGLFDFIDSVEQKIQARKDDYPEWSDWLNTACEWRRISHKMLEHLRQPKPYYYTHNGSLTCCAMCDGDNPFLEK